MVGGPVSFKSPSKRLFQLAFIMAAKHTPTLTNLHWNKIILFIINITIIVITGYPLLLVGGGHLFNV